MEFKRLGLKDLSLCRPYFNLITDYQTCDYTVGGTFMWRDYFKMEYAIEQGVLYTRLYNEKGERFYNLPIGKDFEEGLKVLKNQAKLDGEPLKFCTVPSSQLEKIQAVCDCEVYEQEIFADYLYLSEDLISLRGKKFSPQRNLISQFNRNNPNYSAVTIDGQNVQLIKEFLDKNFCVSNAKSDFEREEIIKTKEALDNLPNFNFVGLALKSEDKIIGFSLGEIVGDVLFYHVEKADKTVKGAYKKLCNLFVCEFACGVKFVNREEDMGDLGLRKSKLDYNPVKILKKYVVEIK